MGGAEVPLFQRACVWGVVFTDRAQWAPCVGKQMGMHEESVVAEECQASPTQSIRQRWHLK